MTKKRMTALMLLLALTAVFLFVLRPFGRRPFAHLKEGDILSASFFITPPGETLPLTDPAQLDELAEILRGHICKGVNFNNCRKGCTRGKAKAVDQPLYHQNPKIHDRLLYRR